MRTLTHKLIRIDVGLGVGDDLSESAASFLNRVWFSQSYPEMGDVQTEECAIDM